MKKPDCYYYGGGYCDKGLPFTPCEIEGCVAYTPLSPKMKETYPITLDEIDQWLFDNFGILPGACSSTENLRHTTARRVAEALWPKKENKK